MGKSGLSRRQNARTLFENKKLAKLIVMKAMHVREKAESKARQEAEGEAAGAGF